MNESNGDSSDHSSQIITELSRELSNTRREYQLCDQIRQQLSKIHKTSAEIKDITTRLLHDRDDLTDDEIQELQQKERQTKTRLAEQEKRLKMLEEIESNGCRLNVKLLSAKKTNKSNTLLIGKKEIRIDNGDSNDTTVKEDREGSAESDYGDGIALPVRGRHRSRVSSSATDLETIDSRFTCELEGELKDLSIKRSGGRKRVVPERFASFPEKKKSLRRFNGRKESDD